MRTFQYVVVTFVTMATRKLNGLLYEKFISKSKIYVGVIKKKNKHSNLLDIFIYVILYIEELVHFSFTFMLA